MKNFENEYRNLVQDDMPNLWDRIEAGLVEKVVQKDGVVPQEEMKLEENQQEVKAQESKVQENKVQENKQQEVVTKEEVVSRNNRTNLYKFIRYAGVAVAACLLFVLVMPTALGMLTTGGSSESAKMAEDAAAPEAPAAMMAENAMESVKMEAAPMEEAKEEAELTEGAAAMEEVAPMEGAAPMEDGVCEETDLAGGATEAAINEEAKTTNAEVETSVVKRSEDVVFLENTGITLIADNITPTGLTIKCTQSGGRPTGELQTGSWYVLQKWTQENGWEEMPYIMDGEIAWTTEAWTIPMDSTCEWEVDWEWLYGTVPNGKYRIGKEIGDFTPNKDYKRAVCFIEFEIAE